MPPPTAGSALRGLRVVDASTWVAGPWCAQLLAWLGAAVTKVDPPGGDPLQQLDDGPRSTGRCLDDDANRGKTRIACASALDRQTRIRAETAAADVLVADAELLAWWPEVRRERPGLVVVAVTPYGLTGPDAGRAGCELTAYHAGGEGATLPSENVARHFPDRPPTRAGCFLADHDAGLTAAVAVVAALVGRARHGDGALVDVSQLDVELGLNRTTLSRSWWEGRDFDRTYRGYDYAGALRCTDGWVAVRPVEERQWISFCDAMGRLDLATDPRFADRVRRYDNADALTVELERWTTVRTAGEVRAALLAAGCPGGPFLSPAEILADPAINSRGLLGPVEADGGGTAPVRGFRHVDATPATGTPLPALGRGDAPLSGVRVVDLTWVAAGPYATELLAFLGAEVIRVESRARPDIFRRSQDDPQADLDASVRWMDLNQAKRSVEGDLKDGADKDAVLDLIARSHVVAENYRPGVRDRLGLADRAIFARNPTAVVLALSGFGTDALDSDRPGYASVFNAEGGLGWMTGYPDAAPSDVRDTNDLRGGTLGALATCSALLALLRGGAGTVLDVATRDALVVLQGHLLLAASRGGTPTRSGNALADCVPYDCFRSADDRWVAVGVRTDDEWAALVRATGIDGPADRNERVAARAAVDGALAAWVAARSATDVVRELRTAGVPVGLSAAGSDIAADPHVRARGSIRRVVHPVLGDLDLVQAPFVFDGLRRAYRRPPLLGEDTDALLRAPARL